MPGLVLLFREQDPLVLHDVGVKLIAVADVLEAASTVTPSASGNVRFSVIQQLPSASLQMVYFFAFAEDGDTGLALVPVASAPLMSYNVRFTTLKQKLDANIPS